MSENKAFAVNRLAGSLGAELSGLDLSQPLRPQDLAALRSAWLEHGVVFLRDQHLSSEQFLAFAQAMGTPVEYPFVKGIDGFPVIIEIKKLEHEKVNFGGVWHSDTAYLEQPPMATMLLAREIPPYGGDTMFSNQVQAYESLSDGMKRLLDGLVAVNTSAKADVTRTREDRLAEVGRTDANSQYEAEHPVVRTHPDRHDRRGKRAAAAVFICTPEEGRVHLPFSLAGGLDCALGQPLHAPFSDQRLPRFSASPAPHHAGGRPAPALT